VDGDRDGRNAVPIEVAQALAHSEDRQILSAELRVVLLHAVRDQRRLHQIPRVKNNQLSASWRGNEAHNGDE
jgi:hypothetical protein